MCIGHLSSQNLKLECEEIFAEAVINEEEDFNMRDEWQDEVNSWTILSENVYNRNLILEHVNFVPDFVFQCEYIAFKYEDPTNDNIMICKECFHKQFNTYPIIWREEGIVEPFDFKDIYEQEDLWCMNCDKALFLYNSTD